MVQRPVLSIVVTLSLVLIQIRPNHGSSSSSSYWTRPLLVSHYRGLECRGGGAAAAALTTGRGGSIELNPSYHGYRSSIQRNEHEEWLQQQQQYQQRQEDRQYYQQRSFPETRRQGNQPSSFLSNIRMYFVTLHELSPSLFWTMISCIAIFSLWQVPLVTHRQNYILSTWFINSQQNTKKTLGASLILSSLSHISPSHLFFNLLALSNFGPSVYRLIQQQQRTQRRFTMVKKTDTSVTIWPLLVSSAIFSNVAESMLTNRRSGGGSSLGLSGVTMALFAIKARAEPYHPLGFLLWGVIPISLQAQYLLWLLMGTSLLGYLAPWEHHGVKKDNIAHMAHLAGLIFGIGYHEFSILGLQVSQAVEKVRRQMRMALS